MQKVVITGGNKGIGLEITKLFIENNYQVVVIGRDFSHISPEVMQTVELQHFDLHQVEQIPSLVQKIPNCDILINNAGVMHSRPFDNYSKDMRDSILRVNLEAPVELINCFSQHMIEKGEGRIISMASVAGQTGHPDIWYGITKAGVINFTKSFAKLLGEKGIVVNCVAPSIVEGTQMFESISEDRKRDQLERVITHSFIDPKSVAETVYWLATSAPKYINGACIDINNGAHFR